MADSLSSIGRLKGSTAELNSRLQQDAKEREAEGKRQGSIILSQNDVLTGNWDAHKVLFTTLGGQIRPITAEDLATFRRNINTAQQKLKKGVTAQQVIDWSAGIVTGNIKSDLSRARDEIKMAVPVGAQKGRLRFITNAGPDSKVSRHHVIVEFLNYGAEAASGSSTARQSALRLRRGPIKIECDCERWRYWFRYIATIGGFNAGRAETGFPKIKNPRLQGIACKHIVKVMHEVKSGGAALNYMVRLMEKAKASDTGHAELRMRQAAAERAAKNQARSQNNIKTSEQKRQERSAAQARKDAAEKLKLQHQKQPHQKRKRPNKKQVNDALSVLSQQFPNLTRDQILAMLTQANQG